MEKRPAGEAEHEAKRAEDNLPLDARTGEPIEPENRGRLERPTDSDRGKDRRGLADNADREPHDHG